MTEHVKSDPEQVLVELIERHGSALLRDRGRLKALLWDLCHDRPRERRVLFAAVEIGLAADLARNGGAVAWEILGARLVNLLHDETGIDLGLAGWAVETWAVALGVLPRPRLRAAPARGGAPGISAPPSPSPAAAPSPPAPAPSRGARCGIAAGDWAAIPAGEFLMGSPAGEAKRDDDERQHLVRVAAFRMLRTPVTWRMYEIFCQAAGRALPKAPSWGRIADHPAVNVSYWDALAYADWVATETGWRCRLPTEAEWEYACRAGTTTPFWTGATITTDQANYDGNHTYGAGPTGVYRARTTPVTAFAANPWGLRDMHGNVWEWTCSAHRDDYDGSELVCESKDHAGAVALRGGSWGYVPTWVRSASRYWDSPDLRNDFIGFRLVQD